MRAPDDCDQLFRLIAASRRLTTCFGRSRPACGRGWLTKVVLCNDRLDDAGDGGLAEHVHPWGDHGAAPGEGLSPGIVERANEGSFIVTFVHWSGEVDTMNTEQIR